MLQPDVWQHVLTFLSKLDLGSVGGVNRELNEWASDDRFWKSYCERQWDGKHGEALLSIRDDDDDDDRDSNNDDDDADGDCENHTANNNSAEPSPSWWSSFTNKVLGYGGPSDTNRHRRLPSISFLSSLSSSKQRYSAVANDALRKTIAKEEVCYYSWKLLYNNQGDSNLGVRKFLNDGTFHSPYFGVCEWALSHKGDTLLLMGLRLQVERDPNTWGWIIGKGTSTVYVSVDRNVALSAE